jgi:hypothetical protein
MAGTVLVTGAPARSRRGPAAAGRRGRPGLRRRPHAGQGRSPGARRHRTVALDLDRPDTWPPALDGIEEVFLVGYAGPRFAETLGALAAAARRAGPRRLVKLVEAGADFALELLELCVLIGLGYRGSRPGGPGRPRSPPGVGLLLLVVVWGRSSLQCAGGAGNTGPCGLGCGCASEQVWRRSMLAGGLAWPGSWPAWWW